MATVIREAFAGRVVASSTGQPGQPGQQPGKGGPKTEKTEKDAKGEAEKKEDEEKPEAKVIRREELEDGYSTQLGQPCWNPPLN